MDHVSYGYEGRSRALQDISLTVPKRNGGALWWAYPAVEKSTTASLLMRFCDPLSGNIYIEGKDYCSMKPEELRKHIAMVPQQVNLFSGTIRENLLLADPGRKGCCAFRGIGRSGTGRFYPLPE